MTKKSNPVLILCQFKGSHVYFCFFFLSSVDFTWLSSRYSKPSHWLCYLEETLCLNAKSGDKISLYKKVSFFSRTIVNLLVGVFILYSTVICLALAISQQYLSCYFFPGNCYTNNLLPDILNITSISD